jgi:nucleotide-binding universal stress UspA family protein
LPEKKQRLVVIVTVRDCPPAVAAEAGISLFSKLSQEPAIMPQADVSRIAIKTILLATDFSVEARSALQYAVSLSKRHESKLVIVHSLPRESAVVGKSGSLISDALRHDAEKSMTKLGKTTGLKALPHESIIRTGDSWDVISEVLLDKYIDLIVMGTHGRGGIKKLILGSTAEKIIRHAPCPVLTVGPHVALKSSKRFGHIFYASDFSSGSRRSLPYAVSMAEEDRAHLTMLHVIDRDPISRSEVREWKQESREKLRQMVSSDLNLPYKPEIEVEFGIPEREIVRQAQARNADLIVMGSHSGGMLSRHLPWTTLHYVLQHAHCPVLSVRGEVDTPQAHTLVSE